MLEISLKLKLIKAWLGLACLLFLQALGLQFFQAKLFSKLGLACGFEILKKLGLACQIDGLIQVYFFDPI